MGTLLVSGSLKTEGPMANLHANGAIASNGRSLNIEGKISSSSKVSGTITRSVSKDEQTKKIQLRSLSVSKMLDRNQNTDRIILNKDGNVSRIIRGTVKQLTENELENFHYKNGIWSIDGDKINIDSSIQCDTELDILAKTVYLNGMLLVSGDLNIFGELNLNGDAGKSLSDATNNVGNTVSKAWEDTKTEATRVSGNVGNTVSKAWEDTKAEASRVWENYLCHRDWEHGYVKKARDVGLDGEWNTIISLQNKDSNYCVPVSAAMLTRYLAVKMNKKTTDCYEIRLDRNETLRWEADRRSDLVSDFANRFGTSRNGGTAWWKLFYHVPMHLKSKWGSCGIYNKAVTTTLTPFNKLGIFETIKSEIRADKPVLLSLAQGSVSEGYNGNSLGDHTMPVIGYKQEHKQGLCYILPDRRYVLVDTTWSRVRGASNDYMATHPYRPGKMWVMMDYYGNTFLSGAVTSASDNATYYFNQFRIFHIWF